VTAWRSFLLSGGEGRFDPDQQQTCHPCCLSPLTFRQAAGVYHLGGEPHFESGASPVL